MQKGLVSILCLSMNHEKYVEQGFGSAVGQTYRDIEILYVDNNSKDRTFEIADRLFRISGLPYKGYKRTENYGISANLNFLLKEAKGEFVALLSGDDWWEKDNLALKIECFRANPEYAMVYSNGYKYFELEKKQHVFYEKEQKSGELFSDLLKGNLFYGVSVVTRYEALKDVGFFDEALPIEDWDMYLRIAQKYQIGYVHQPISYSRVTGNNLSSNIEFMNNGYDQYFKKYRQYPEMEEARKNIKLAQAHQLAIYAPGFKSLKYIFRNMQWHPNYLKQVAICMVGIIGIRKKQKTGS